MSSEHNLLFDEVVALLPDNVVVSIHRGNLFELAHFIRSSNGVLLLTLGLMVPLARYLPSSLFFRIYFPFLGLFLLTILLTGYVSRFEFVELVFVWEEEVVEYEVVHGIQKFFSEVLPSSVIHSSPVQVTVRLQGRSRERNRAEQVFQGISEEVQKTSFGD